MSERFGRSKDAPSRSRLVLTVYHVLAMIDTTRFPGDPLSTAARRVLRINKDHAYTALVLPSFVSGPAEAYELLDTLSPAGLFDGNVADPHAAACVHAGLWLWHDFSEAAHRIAQVIETPAGAFWHALLHRREGDFANAKYWYAQCRGHVSLATIGAQVADLLRDAPADKTLLKLALDGWSGAAFVDLVETVHARPNDPRHGLAVVLQQIEWRLLFDQCVREVAEK